MNNTTEQALLEALDRRLDRVRREMEELILQRGAAHGEASYDAAEIDGNLLLGNVLESAVQGRKINPRQIGRTVARKVGQDVGTGLAQLLFDNTPSTTRSSTHQWGNQLLSFLTKSQRNQ
jgi:hypothetical protein